MPPPDTIQGNAAITPKELRSQDLALTVLSVLLMLVLIGGALWVLRPFLLSLIWATMIVVATWPLLLKVQAALRRRALAVTIMAAAMLMVFVVPLFLAIDTVVRNIDTITSWLRWLTTADVPPPPAWVPTLPVVGGRLAERWTSIAAGGQEELAARMAPYLGDAAQGLLGAFGSIGLLVVQFLLTVMLCVVMFARGEIARDALIRLGGRIAGERGQGAVILAGSAIRAVALGVVVTALAQTTLAGLGLAAAGVPFTGLLTGIILLLCIAQVGPFLVLLPAALWLFWTGQSGWGTALLVWTFVVGVLDNVVRPLLIRQGADLPLLLIFAGVIGGLIAFGIVGLFVGPVVLAVGYTLLKQWMAVDAAPRRT